MDTADDSADAVQMDVNKNDCEDKDKYCQANTRNEKHQKKTKKKKSERLGKSKSSKCNVGYQNKDGLDDGKKQTGAFVVDDENDTMKDMTSEKKLKKKKSKRNSSKRHGLGDGNTEDTDKSEVLNKKEKKAEKETEAKSNSSEKKIEKKEKRQKKKTQQSEQKKEKSKAKGRQEGGKHNHHEVLLEHVLKRVSHFRMENPTEFLLVGGDTGVGKTTWIETETRKILLQLRQDENKEEDDDENKNSEGEDAIGTKNHYCFPVICRGTCENSPPNRESNNDDDYSDDRSSSSAASTPTPTPTPTQSFADNDFGLGWPPMHAITEALNDLIRNLTAPTADFGGRAAWRKWFSEALGTTEAAYLASTGLVPELGFLMDLPELQNTHDGGISEKNNSDASTKIKPKKKQSFSWDWNSPYKFHRSCLAVRDLLRAVSESRHPVIMIINNLHEVDEDTRRLLTFLLTGDRWDQERIAEAKKTDAASGKNQQLDIESIEDIAIASSRLQNFLLVGIYADDLKRKHGNLEALEREFLRRQHLNWTGQEQQLFGKELEVGSIESQETFQKRSHLTKVRVEPQLDRVEEVLLSTLVGLTEHDSRNSEETSVKKDGIRKLAQIIYEWTDGNAYFALQVLEYLKEKGTITSCLPCKWNEKEVGAELSQLENNAMELTAFRLDRLPEAVRFALINVSAIRQTRIGISSSHFFLLLKAAYGATKEFPFESVSELERAFEIACESRFMKRISCDQGSHHDGHRWAFLHTITRDAAHSLFKKQEMKTQVWVRLGTEALAMAANNDLALTNKECNALKFLAANQLATADETLDKDSNSTALLFVEIAEICISRSAFCAATRYLKLGMGMLERNGGLFTARNHITCIRMHLLLVRIHSVCYGDQDKVEMKKLFRTIVQNCKNLKDQIMLRQVQIEIFVGEKKYQKALDKILETLDMLGQKLPNFRDLPNAISCEFQELVEQTRSMDSAKLYQPHRCTQRKLFDVMSLLSDLLEISRLCQNDGYQELAMIRMMNISLISGFTRQYSTSFACYGASLIKQSFATDNFKVFREGYRMGRVCEKVARVNDFHGGQSLAIFHYYISHLKRPYRLSLGQVLGIYNKQLESGDYFHVRFTMFTYIQYHLASGHDLTKLDDNLQLFDALYHDYKLEDSWQIQLPQRFVANMLDEASDPFLLFGIEVKDQEAQIRRMEEAGESDAVNFMHFLILFASIFFHNIELSKSCLEKVNEEKIIPLWKPWVIFFQCLTDILSLPTIENKANRKKMKENIHEKKDRLTGWYNEGAINCSVLVALLDAECTVTDPPGKKPLSALKIKKMYDDAIAVARQQELKHIEALCLERASMRLEAANAKSLSAEYMARAHQCYVKWNAVAKVVEIERIHALKLKFSRKEKVVGAGYVRQNSDLRYDPNQVIGGRPDSIEPITVKDAVKTVGKVKDIVLRKYKSERNVTRERSPLSQGSSLRECARSFSLKTTSQTFPLRNKFYSGNGSQDM